jgi:group I intron endonuclease
MNTGIYKITNLINGKFYVGSASSNGGFRKRWNEHKSNLNQGKHCNKHLQSAWIKYGADSFYFEIIEIVNPSIILEREQFYLDTLKPDYNVCKVAGNTLGVKLSQQQKDNLSKIGKLRTGEKNPFFNKKHSEDTKILQSKIRKEQQKRDGHPRLGIPRSEESKLKQSLAMKGKESKIKIPVQQLSILDEPIKNWESISDAAFKLGLFSGNITSACKGRLKSTGGFKWKYIKISL